jgi:hypothetical protein
MDRRALFIFGICAAPRLLAMAMWPSRAPTYYDTLATELLTNGSFGFSGVPTNYMEPLYPAFLAAARFVTFGFEPAVTLAQVAVAALGGVLLYRLAAHLAGPRVGLCAGVLYALNPYLVRQSVARLEITLCLTLAIAATLALTRTERWRGAMGAGVLFGLLILTRTTFLPAALGAVVWLAWRPSTALGTGPSTERGAGASTGRWPGWRLAAVMLCTAVAVQAPWVVRNMRVDGSALPSRLGENLYVSTSVYAAALPVHDIDLLAVLALGELVDVPIPPGEGERYLDDFMMARSVAFLREHPGRVLWWKARNALYLLTPQLLPRDAKGPASYAVLEGETVRIVNPVRRPWVEELSHALAQGALLLLAAVGIAQRRLRMADAPLLIMLGAQAAICIAFFPTTRLMAPVMFVVMFYAAVGFTNSSAAAPRQR